MPIDNCEIAQALAAQGLPVVPCDPKTKAAYPRADMHDGKKVPKSGGFYKRTTDADTIRDWWARVPEAMIGYVPGDVGCVGIDIDEGGPECGRAIVGLLGAPLAKMRSGKAGRFHLLYRFDGDNVGNGTWQRCQGKGQVRHHSGYLIAWQPDALLASLQSRTGAVVPDGLLEYFMGKGQATLIDVAAAAVASSDHGEHNDTLNRETYKALMSGANPHALIPAMHAAALSVGHAEQRTRDTLARVLQDVQEKQPAAAASDGNRIYPRHARTRTGLIDALESVGWEMRYNTRRDIAELRRTEPSERPDTNDGWVPMTRRSESYIRSVLGEAVQDATGKPYTFARENWQGLWLAAQHEHEADPFLEWLESLPAWDGKPYLGDLLAVVGADVTDPLVRHAGESLLLCCAHRALTPGYKHDEMVILVGPQGCGKSTFCRHLLPPQFAQWWFGDGFHFADDPRRRVEATLGKVIVEASELTGLRRAEVESLKAYLTAREDYVRLAFRPDPEIMPRRFVLVGTANDAGSGVLPNDPTGLRRFLPVRVTGAPDGVGAMMRVLDRVREQAWAEALHRAKAGESPRVPDDLQGRHEAVAEQYRTKNTLLEESLDTYIDENPTLFAEGLPLMQICDAVGVDRRHEKAVIGELKRRGLKVTRIRRGERQVRVWTT